MRSSMTGSGPITGMKRRPEGTITTQSRHRIGSRQAALAQRADEDDVQ